MLNPFTKFEKRFIEAFIKAKKLYLVSQTFTREDNLFKKEGKDYLFLTHYDDKGSAQIHFNALSGDKYAALLDLENEKHREKLISMLSPESKYVLYSSLIVNPKMMEEALNKTLSYKVKRYLETNTNWRIGRDQTIYPKAELVFGELCVSIRFGSQTLKVKLSDIENA